MSSSAALPGWPTGPAASLVAWWRARSVVARDAVLAAGVVCLALVPGAQGSAVVLGGLVTRGVDGLGVLLVLGQGLPLVVRRRAPAAALGLVGLSFAAHQVLGYPPTATSLGLLLALASAGAHLQRGRRGTALAACAGYAGLALLLHMAGLPETVTDYVTVFVLLAAFWGAGSWVRARAAAEAARRQRKARDAVVEERARIARELHDVVTHHVIAMVVQADAAATASPPEPTAAALGRIAAAGRQAMVELRHQLGTLQNLGPDGPDDRDDRRDDVRAPLPGRLRDLVNNAASAGQAVHLREEGDLGGFGNGLHLAVYRIVQESLTNARKHAPGATTEVLVRCTGAGVNVEATTHPRPPAEGGSTPVTSAVLSGQRPVQGSGRGLIGMQERAAALGGQLDATPLPGGGFQVIARIPAPGGRG